MDKQRYFELLSKEKALRAKNLSLDKINNDYGLHLIQSLPKQISVYWFNSKMYQGWNKLLGITVEFFRYYKHLEICDKKTTIMSLNKDEISFYTDSKI